MNTPKISVIVPVYNVEQYLPRCIDSILDQTFTDFELLLIDDGSTDKSGKICDKYAEKDSRIRVFHKENGGVSSARNLGIDKARGELISFIDSDDWVEACYIDTIVSDMGNADIMFFAFTLHYNDGCSNSILYGNYTTEGKDGIERCILKLKSNSTKINLFGFTWNKVFRGNLIQKHCIKFDEKLNVSEDEIFTFEFCLNASIIKISSKTLYNYRWRDNGLTHERIPFQTWVYLASYADGLIKKIGNIELKQLYIRWRYFILLRACHSSRSIIEFIESTFNAYAYARRHKIENHKKKLFKMFYTKCFRF